MVTHDLRSPLRAIIGFAQALREDFAVQLGDKGLTLIGYIAEAARTMDQLTIDLMTYTRVGRADLKWSRVDMGRVLAAARDELKEQIKKQGASITVPEPLPVVRGHYGNLVQVMRQLLSNAILYHRPDRLPQVTVRSEHRGVFWRIWVEDNGIGVSEESQERIFGILDRLHGVEAFPGSGLGLAIVRRAARNLGGECGVESVPDRGSRFWIDLPSDNSQS
jgi:signal transduction histidine kinase